MRLSVRNDKTGLWDFSDLADALPAQPLVHRRANFIKLDNQNYGEAVDIVRSFVRISATMPVKIDGFPRAKKVGFGLVIDADQGLILVSRAIVPYDLCDIAITIAESVLIDGKVVFMHPLQNYAIIKYDPSLVQAPIKSAKLSSRYIKQGDDVIFFGFNQNFRPVVVKTVVTDITTVAIPASAATPRYRAINLDAVTIDTNLASQCGTGVLVTEDGTVHALWLTYLGERTASGKDTEYHLGLATSMVLPVVNQILKGITPKLRILNMETHTIQMSQARIMGVAECKYFTLNNPCQSLIDLSNSMDRARRTRGPRETPAVHGPQGRLRSRGRLARRRCHLDLKRQAHHPHSESGCHVRQ